MNLLHHRGDVLQSAAAGHQSGCSVLHSLQFANENVRDAEKESVRMVEFRYPTVAK